MSDDEVRAKCVEVITSVINEWAGTDIAHKRLAEQIFDALDVKPWYRLADGRWTFIEKASRGAPSAVRTVHHPGGLIP